MTGTEFTALLSSVRPRGEKSWLARCPAHQDSSPSLSVAEIDNKILVKCFAGCTTADIVKAMKLVMADLFIDNYKRPNKAAFARKRAAATLEKWRDLEVTKLGENLRLRDELARAVSEMVAAGQMSEEMASEYLELAYRDYSSFEHAFDCLRRGENVLELFRRSTQ